MRRIGTLPDENEARRFGDYLLVQEIDNQVDSDDEGGWVIWVHSEDRVPEAKERFARFQANPSDAEFSGVQREAKSIRSEREKAATRSRARQIDVRTTWGTRGVAAAGPATSVLVFASIGVFFLGLLGVPVFAYLAMGPIDFMLSTGQIWRFLTPIFLHFGIIHLLFNMYWTWQFGSMIEYQLGTRWLALVVLGIGVGSNLAQYAVVGPGFGGMSGVVYGLFGYIWMRAKHDSGSGLVMNPGTVQVLMFWFVLCWLPILPFGVANWAHAGGLVIGAAWGYIDAGMLKRRS